MKLIGRKLVMDWGHVIVSIEKIVKTEDGPYTHLPKEGALLYDITKYGEIPLGPPAFFKWGHDLNWYMSIGWYTQEELDESNETNNK